MLRLTCRAQKFEPALQQVDFGIDGERIVKPGRICPSWNQADYGFGITGEPLRVRPSKPLQLSRKRRIYENQLSGPFVDQSVTAFLKHDPTRCDDRAHTVSARVEINRAKRFVNDLHELRRREAAVAIFLVPLPPIATFRGPSPGIRREDREQALKAGYRSLSAFQTGHGRTIETCSLCCFRDRPTTFLPLGAQLIDNRPAWTDTGQVQFECCHCQYERRDRASALLEPLDLLGSYTDPVRQRFLKPALGPPSRAQFFDQNMNSPSIIFSTELS